MTRQDTNTEIQLAQTYQKESGNMFLRNRLLQLTLIVLSVAIGMQAEDSGSCSNATLHGSYGLHATGTYSVSPDCIVTNNFGGGSHVSVIVDHGKGYYILNNAPAAGATISGEAKRQSLDECRTKDHD